MNSKLKRHLHKPFKFKNIYRMKKMSYYCNKRHKVPKYLKSHIAYEFFCPACNNAYIGKSDLNFDTCVQEQINSGKESPVYNHLLQFEHFSYVVIQHGLPPSNNLVEYLEHAKFSVKSTTIKIELDYTC